MSSAVPKTFGISLTIWSILDWNISPAGTGPKGRSLYWYLPNGHVNVVRYDNWVSNHKLWYPKLTSIIDMYFTLFSLGNISLSVGLLFISLIKAWFSHVGSRHSLTLPFALGTNTKLLHHSAISSIPNGVMMSIFCRYSSSSLNGFCNMYATCLGGTWYGLLSGLSCKENVPLKHPIPLDMSPNVSWIFCILALLFLLSASTLSDENKELIDLFVVAWPFWPLAFCVVLSPVAMFVQPFDTVCVSCPMFESVFPVLCLFYTLPPLLAQNQCLD